MTDLDPLMKRSSPNTGDLLFYRAHGAGPHRGVTNSVSRSSDPQRTVSRVTTGIVIPLLIGLLATDVSGRTLVVCLALVVLAHLWFEQRLPPIQGQV